MDTWFDINPERWDREQKTLKETNIDFQIDLEAKARGILHLYVTITKESKLVVSEKFLPIKLTATFPSAYPYFRPEVCAPDLSLPRHQNIVAKNLCLLPRETVNWLPETTLANYITEQLPKVLTEGEITDPDVLMFNNDEQAEPVSVYYPNEVGASIIFNPEPFDLLLKSSNKKAEQLGTVNIGIPEAATAPTRMAVLESFDNSKQSLGKLPDAVNDIFLPRITGSIYRLQDRPPNANASEDYKWLISLLDEQKEKLLKPRNSITLKKGSTVENVIGLTFPEEHSPGRFSSGWLFIVVISAPTQKIIQKRIVPFKEKRLYYANANRINTNELSFRIASLKPLADKKIAVFGLGALGAPSVLGFAKNGIKELRIIDYDIVNAGTTVRWPLGIKSAGMFKTQALKKFIDENYPFTNVLNYQFKVGGIDTPDNQTLRNILDDVSLIYDATAEIGVNHFLSREAQNRKIPYICIFGTPGVWGGVAIRVVPNITEGCWMCFQYLLTDGMIPSPPTNRDGNIQAAGCGDISFTGASFELDNIVSTGVRLAVGTLCSFEAGYPNLNPDVGVLSLVDEYGNPKFPTWSGHKLTKHPNCPYCNT